MQGLWYGDRRDRVKWGALLLLSQTLLIPTIVQVAYYRRGDDPLLETPDGEVALPSVVWNHFSDLRHIKKLGNATGVKILVLDDSFEPPDRRSYVAGVVSRLKVIKSPKIVFLDPDTGIEPGTARPAHVTKTDITEIWNSLSAKDVLVIYQHADRTKTWRKARARTMVAACGGTPVQVIVGKGVAADVAMLWCQKS